MTKKKHNNIEQGSNSFPRLNSDCEAGLDKSATFRKKKCKIRLAIGESVCTHEYEILDEIRESSISDDEEPGDWAGYGLLLVRLPVFGAARRVAQLITSASGHQLERDAPALVGGQAAGSVRARMELRDARLATEARYKYTGINYNTWLVCLLGDI